MDYIKREEFFSAKWGASVCEISEIPDSPCKTCPLNKICEKKELACTAAYNFIMYGQTVTRNEMMTPNKEIYNELFNSDDEDEKEAA